MATLWRRMWGAARLDAATYEDVEADRGATGQAVLLALAVSVAGGIGAAALRSLSVQTVLVGAAGDMVGWAAWAALTYLIGTRLLPQPQTRADLGELLRTLAFAGTPGLLRIFGGVPVLGRPIYAVAALWMLAAMVVAVRQALDYTGTGRAVVVCVVGWALSLVLAAAIGAVFAPVVS